MDNINRPENRNFYNDTFRVNNFRDYNPDRDFFRQYNNRKFRPRFNANNIRNNYNNRNNFDRNKNVRNN